VKKWGSGVGSRRHEAARDSPLSIFCLQTPLHVDCPLLACSILYSLDILGVEKEEGGCGGKVGNEEACGACCLCEELCSAFFFKILHHIQSNRVWTKKQRLCTKGEGR
jgi:hypothetical protein